MSIELWIVCFCYKLSSFRAEIHHYNIIEFWMGWAHTVFQWDSWLHHCSLSFTAASFSTCLSWWLSPQQAKCCSVWGWPVKDIPPVHSEELFGCFECRLRTVVLLNDEIWAHQRESMVTSTILSKCVSVPLAAVHTWAVTEPPCWTGLVLYISTLFSFHHFNKVFLIFLFHWAIELRSRTLPVYVVRLTIWPFCCLGSVVCFLWWILWIHYIIFFSYARIVLY